jgi:7-cyano-7-deazaguanine synthase
MTNTHVVIPFSGGMDSSVLVHLALSEGYFVHVLSFNYGQRHSQELDCAAKQIQKLKSLYPNLKSYKTIDVSYIKDIAPTSSLTNNDIETPDVRKIKGEAQPKSYVPNRNMMFLSIAAAWAESIGATEVWHGAAQADSLAGYWDGSPEFLESINNVLSLNREKRIEIKAPLIELSKAEIIKLGVKNKVDFGLTYTCYSGEEKPDAYSASSSLRLQGFMEAGYKDPLQYKQQDQLEEVYSKRGCKEIIL